MIELPGSKFLMRKINTDVNPPKKEGVVPIGDQINYETAVYMWGKDNNLKAVCVGRGMDCTKGVKPDALTPRFEEYCEYMRFGALAPSKEYDYPSYPGYYFYNPELVKAGPHNPRLVIMNFGGDKIYVCKQLKNFHAFRKMREWTKANKFSLLSDEVIVNESDILKFLSWAKEAGYISEPMDEDFFHYHEPTEYVTYDKFMVYVGEI